MAKPGIVYALIFDRDNPKESIVLAATIRAWVESRPPETPITILAMPEDFKRFDQTLNLDIIGFVTSLITLGWVGGNIGETRVFSV